MGLIKTVIVLAILAAAGWYAYGHINVDNLDVCQGKQKNMIPVTCQTNEDCVMYLTSAYTAGYPRTNVFTKILSQTSECAKGYCHITSFDFQDNKPNKACGLNETMTPYPVTLKDILAIKGG